MLLLLLFDETRFLKIEINSSIIVHFYNFTIFSTLFYLKNFRNLQRILCIKNLEFGYYLIIYVRN